LLTPEKLSLLPAAEVGVAEPAGTVGADVAVVKLGRVEEVIDVLGRRLLEDAPAGVGGLDVAVPPLSLTDDSGVGGVSLILRGMLVAPTPSRLRGRKRAASRSWARPTADRFGVAATSM
jgi:hypothetical protein